jgi:hypothetical protein
LMRQNKSPTGRTKLQKTLFVTGFGFTHISHLIMILSPHTKPHTKIGRNGPNVRTWTA